MCTIPAVYHRSTVAAHCIEQHQNIRRNQMRRSLVTVVILLAIFISGCNTTPAPQQGPPGQQGAQGQSGQQGQQGDQGQSGQQGYRGDQGQSGQQGHRGDQGESGQQGQQGDQGQSGQQGQQGDQGQSGQQGQRGPGAPCPAGQHRYT